MALPIVYRSPENSNVTTAKKVLKERAEEAARRREARLNAPVPNYICYATTAFKNWKPGDKVPACKVCGGLLHPTENHVCDGYKAKYVEHTPERKEHSEARREEIRKANHEESRENTVARCSECGIELPEYEDFLAHAAEEHEGIRVKPVRNYRAVDGEPDGDLDGYDDEPEEDYCEGDDDGDDCD
jgi:hypothetical protein